MKKTPIIEAVHVTKQYGNVMAVDDLSLAVLPGICFGLLGPNGAGKTTLIEIIEGIIPLLSGQVRFQGQARSASFREKVGIMFQQTALLSFLTVRETLATFQSLYQNTLDIDKLIDLCHLGDIRNQLNDKISGGQRQRLLLALALINQPNLLFLDEPSTGLDPQARRNLWDIINTVKQQGKTIILTTHYMEEAQQLCDEVAIMDHGKIIAQGSPDALIAQHCRGITLILPKAHLNNAMARIPFTITVTQERAVILVDDMNQAVEKLLALGVNLSHMNVQTPNLETVFLNLTGRHLRD